jgi:uncharacterized protein (TIGR03437 family)
MKKLRVCFLLLPASLLAQTADTTFCRAVLLPSSEVPAINNTSRGVADVIVSVVRDSSGQPISGTVDVLVRTTLPAANTATALALHNAAAGQTAPVALDTGLTATSSRALASGADFIHVPIQVPGDNAATLAALRALVQDPTRFYLELASADHTNGLMRGQLQPARGVVLMGVMNSASVVPAPNSDATGVAQVVAIGTADASGNWTSGEVYLWTTTSSADLTAFTSLHIHFGQPGTAGAIGISGTLPPGVIPNPYGAARIAAAYTEITVTNSTQAGAFTNLFVNPTSLYIDVHTTQNPNGMVRAQLRPTDSVTFPLLLDSANETAAPATRVAMPANVTLHTLRNEDGSVAAATMLCDLDLRLSGPDEVLGLYIHDSAAGHDGPMSIMITPDFSLDAGFGNYYNWTPPVTQLGPVEDLLKNPENHYANLHTVSSPAGAVRAQFGGPFNGGASVAAAIAANLDKNATTVAPGGLVSIFGAALAKVPGDLSGWAGQQLPVQFNGTSVSIAGKAAPLIYVSPGQVNAQVPMDVPAGVQPLTVTSSAGPSTAYSITVAPAAPAIFFYPVPAVLKNVNYSLVGSANPAKAGDVLLVYCTGLGQTSPGLTTGALVPATSLPRTGNVTATIGGTTAPVAYSIASPGFTGLYQVAITVPSGVSGTVPLQLQMGNAVSNSVNIPVQ